MRRWHSPDYENNRFGKRKTLIGHVCVEKIGVRSVSQIRMSARDATVFLFSEDQSAQRCCCTWKAEGCIRRSLCLTLWSRLLHSWAPLIGHADYALHVLWQWMNLMYFTKIYYNNVLFSFVKWKVQLSPVQDSDVKSTERVEEQGRIVTTGPLSFVNIML